MQVRHAGGGPCNACAKSHTDGHLALARRGRSLRRFCTRSPAQTPALGAECRPGAIKLPTSQAHAIHPFTLLGASTHGQIHSYFEWSVFNNSCQWCSMQGWISTWCHASRECMQVCNPQVWEWGEGWGAVWACAVCSHLSLRSPCAAADSQRIICSAERCNSKKRRKNKS